MDAAGIHGRSAICWLTIAGSFFEGNGTRTPENSVRASNTSWPTKTLPSFVCAVGYAPPNAWTASAAKLRMFVNWNTNDLRPYVLQPSYHFFASGGFSEAKSTAGVGAELSLCPVFSCRVPFCLKVK